MATKKRKPTDSTMRNVRAANTQIARLVDAVQDLTWCDRHLRKRIEVLERHVTKLERKK